MKIKTLIVCLLAASCINTSVFAQISANTGENDNSIAISGSVSSDEAQVVLLKPGKTVSDAETAVADADKSKLGAVIEYFGQITVNDKNIKTSIPMSADAQKGKYSLIVGNDSYSVYFATYQDRLTNMVPAAKLALSDGTFTQFADNDGKYFCNAGLYESLINGGNAAKYASTILDAYKNASDSDFMKKMTSAMNMGIIMEALNENKVNELSMIESMTDTSDLKVPFEKIDLIKPEKIENIIADVSGKNFASPNVYKKALSESIFVNVLNNAVNMTNADKKAFFDQYAGLLGMNLNAYNNLSENKKKEAIAKLVAENNANLGLMQNSLNGICDSGTVSTVPSGGPGGSPSYSGGVVDTASGIRGISEVVSNVNGGIHDLWECEWARPAIESLIGNKVISGYEDNTFKPLRNISRAEFVSIIVRKYLKVSNYTQTFSDVAKDKWCFNYVESAYNSGIISGIGQDMFAPDANISRQDMAVILCRLAEYLGHEFSGSAPEFADDSKIASYAKDAIYSLKSAGIVNGDDNGNYNPNAFATRAEAAQMIYNFVNFLD